jgi:hypothetical protein
MFSVAALGHESWIFPVASSAAALPIALDQYPRHIPNCLMGLFEQLLRVIRGMGLHKNRLIPLFPSFLL